MEHKKDILIISENPLEAKSLKAEFKNFINCCIVTSGNNALNRIKLNSRFSDIFIPLDLEDMDYSDFIRFSKRYSPDANYILTSPPTLPDLGWLVLSREIDGYIQEPVSLKKVSNYLNCFKQKNRSNLIETDFPTWRPTRYFSGTVFSRT